MLILIITLNCLFHGGSDHLLSRGLVVDGEWSELCLFAIKAGMLCTGMALF